MADRTARNRDVDGSAGVTRNNMIVANPTTSSATPQLVTLLHATSIFAGAVRASSAQEVDEPTTVRSPIPTRRLTSRLTPRLSLGPTSNPSFDRDGGKYFSLVSRDRASLAVRAAVAGILAGFGPVASDLPVVVVVVPVSCVGCDRAPGLR